MGSPVIFKGAIAKFLTKLGIKFEGTQVLDSVNDLELTSDTNIVKANVTGSLRTASGTTAERPSSPTDGETRYNTDLNVVEFYENGSWTSASPSGAFNDMSDPTGFVNTTDSTISYDNGTRQFTVQPAVSSFDFYVKGVKYTKTTAQQVTLDATEGMHFIYFDSAGAIQKTTTWNDSIILSNAYISAIYWDNTNNTRIYFADERHGINMDGQTHLHMHNSFGAQRKTGLALQNFSATPRDGDTDSHAQFDVDSGVIRDEDLEHTLAAQTQIPILYRLGSGGDWRKKTADAFPIIYQGTAGYGAGQRLPYNEFTGTTWQLSEVTSGKWVLVHFFGINEVDAGHKIVGVQGQVEYDNLADARQGANDEISSLEGLPFLEFVPIGSVIFETDDGFANTPKARCVQLENGDEYVDFRGADISAISGAASNHSTLSGLANDDHTHYVHKTGRAGGQTIQGGNASGDDLTLESTSDATKGDIILNSEISGTGVKDEDAMTSNSDKHLATQQSIKAYTDNSISTHDVANNHIDWTADANPNDVHQNNITQASVTQHEGAINHDNLTGFVAQEHIRWDQTGAEDVHQDRYIRGLDHVRISSTDSPYAASLNENILVDTSTGAVEIDLPNITAEGTIQIRDVTGDAGTNSITIDPHTSDTIFEQTAGEDMLLDQDNMWVQLDADATTGNWQVSGAATGGNYSEATNTSKGTTYHWKQYTESDVTFSSTPTGWNIRRAVFIPYQTYNGIWRLRLNIVADMTSGTNGSFTIDGTTFNSTTANYQALAIAGSTIGMFAQTNPGSGTVTVTYASGFTVIRISGDIELDSKPTWAD